MDWTQFATLSLSFIAIFIWNRTESRNDLRHMDSQLQANRELLREIHNENMEERKDFHGRLCAIEESRNRSR